MNEEHQERPACTELSAVEEEDETAPTTTTTTTKSNQNRLVEFIHDLKEAIETGKLHHQHQASSAAHLNKLINVDSLSNQTFSYIISWLKQQQQEKTKQLDTQFNFAKVRPASSQFEICSSSVI